MQEGRRLPRPLTAQLKVAEDVLFTDITFAIWEQLGKGAIHCVAGVGQGRWQVTFTTQEHLDRAKTAGLKIRNEISTFEPLEESTMWITIRGAPFEMSRNLVAFALAPYGQMLHHEFEVPKETAPVTTGVRRVQMKMRRPVPNFLKVGVYNLMCTYRGVARLCRRCFEEGHMASECRSSFCQACKTWGHAVQDCPESRLRDESIESRFGQNNTALNTGEDDGVERSEPENPVPLIEPRMETEKPDSGQEQFEEDQDSKSSGPAGSATNLNAERKKKKKKNRTRAPVNTKPLVKTAPDVSSHVEFPNLPTSSISEEESSLLTAAQRQKEASVSDSDCSLHIDLDRVDTISYQDESEDSFASVTTTPRQRDRSPIKEGSDSKIGELVTLGQGTDKDRRRTRRQTARRDEPPDPERS